jgi:flagellar hook protein FlgE
MLRSMFSGVSGLRSHQTMMDVIGNNIANVNTVGYKASTAVFADLLSQQISGAGAPTLTAGGTNPTQVGLGSKVEAISTSFTQGAAQLTGRDTDLSINGDGFFVVNKNGQQLVTRAGSLSFDSQGRVTSPDGGLVQGWPAAASGAINPNAAVADLQMPLGQTIAPSATTTLRLGGNLDAAAVAGANITSSIDVFDRQGTPVTATFTMTKTAVANQWTMSATATGPNSTVLPVTVAPATITFDPATGQITNGPFGMTIGGGNFPGPVNIDFGVPGTAAAFSQFSGASSLTGLSQDGFAMGQLNGFTIGPDGVVTGVFSNGRNRSIGQIALANFSNPAGLEKVGDSEFRATVNSGLAQIGTANSGGRGNFSGSTLEMSNVDLAREFTNLIVAQRGFQANSRVITSADELLQELVNLKR